MIFASLILHNNIESDSFLAEHFEILDFMVI